MTALRVAVVDWSAAAQLSPRAPSADAIWIGTCTPEGETVHYLRSRAEAEALLTRLTATGQWLVGFDFPMGYPTGFAARLTGQATARAVWDWLDARIIDGPRNRNNRFEVAAGINRRFGQGPFWGRPAGLDLLDLPPRKLVDYPALGLAERRAVERAVPGAQPVWKLYTTGSVGSQSLTGLPLIARLARRAGVAVWPFAPPGPLARVTLAEVYPSILAPEVRAAGDAIKDRAQVRLLARALARLAGRGDLEPLWSAPAIAREEGWILGAGHRAALAGAL